MPAFEYTAVDSGGKNTKGVLEGDTARQVRQLLREKSLLPLSVEEISEKTSTPGGGFSIGRGMSAKDLSLVTRQLATLVQSGMPLEEALQAVADQMESAKVKTIMLGVRSRVMEGHALAEGLGDFPRAFPEIYRATVSAGEQSGFLDAVLERLADYTENRQALRQKVRNAMIYPVVLTVFALGIVSGMLVYVVPRVVGVFSSSQRELPGLTQALITLSDFLQNWGFALVIVVLLAAGGLWKLLQQPGPRRVRDEFYLKLPLISTLTRGFNTARFTQTFSILSGSGVPVLDSLRIAGEVVTNIPMQEAVAEAAVQIREGGAIGKSLGASGYFPPICIHLISSGEASGQLEDMLARAAENQEREMDGLINTLMGILEPLLIIGMGVMVFLIVIAILLPIFEMNTLIG